MAASTSSTPTSYFLVHHRREATRPEAVHRAGVRWKIEENNETAKQITGLGQYQVRRWNSWHRRVTCSMLALALLTVQRSHRPEPEPDTVPQETPEQADEAGMARQPVEGSPRR